MRVGASDALQSGLRDAELQEVLFRGGGGVLDDIVDQQEVGVRKIG